MQACCEAGAGKAQFLHVQWYSVCTAVQATVFTPGWVSLLQYPLPETLTLSSYTRCCSAMQLTLPILRLVDRQGPSGLLPLGYPSNAAYPGCTQGGGVVGTKWSAATELSELLLKNPGGSPLDLGTHSPHYWAFSYWPLSDCDRAKALAPCNTLNSPCPQDGSKGG